MTTTETDEKRKNPTDGDCAAMIEWLGWTIQKSEMVEATASALRTACQKVLAVEDDWGSIPVADLDVESIIGRFRIKHRGDMKDATVDTYVNRLRQTLDMYTKWLVGDSTWKPAQRKRTARTPSTNGAAGKVPPVEPVTPLEAPKVDQPPKAGMIAYPFPIRPGLRGKIELPEDLTIKEARRIAAFISTLAVEEEPEPLALEARPVNPWDEE